MIHSLNPLHTRNEDTPTPHMVRTMSTNQSRKNWPKYEEVLFMPTFGALFVRNGCRIKSSNLPLSAWVSHSYTRNREVLGHSVGATVDGLRVIVTTGR